MANSARRKLKLMERVRVRSAAERMQQILDERTERLAARTDAAAAPAQALSRVLVCSAGRERFGFPIDMVAEVLPPQRCTPVPDGPPALIGLFGRGRRLVSVIDLAVVLGIENGAPEDGSSDYHFILLRRDQPQVALRVARADTVADVLPLTGEEAGGFRNEAVTSYGKVRLGTDDLDTTLSLLDPERLLRSFLPTLSVPGA